MTRILAISAIISMLLLFSSLAVSAQMPGMPNMGLTGKYTNTKWGLEFMIPNGYTALDFGTSEQIIITLMPNSFESGLDTISIELHINPDIPMSSLPPYTDSDPCMFNSGSANINGQEFLVTSTGCTSPIKKSYVTSNGGIDYNMFSIVKDYAKLAPFDEMMKSVKIGKSLHQDTTKEVKKETKKEVKKDTKTKKEVKKDSMPDISKMPSMLKEASGKQTYAKWGLEFMIPNGYTGGGSDAYGVGLTILIHPKSSESAYDTITISAKVGEPEPTEPLAPYVYSPDNCLYNSGSTNINGKQFVVTNIGCTSPVTKIYSAAENGIIYTVGVLAMTPDMLTAIDDIAKSMKIGKSSLQDTTKDAKKETKKEVKKDTKTKKEVKKDTKTTKKEVKKDTKKKVKKDTKN